MTQKPIAILSIAAALAALSTAAEATIPATSDAAGPTNAPSPVEATQANAFFQVGHDLMGMTVTERADGTLFAGHSSHASHASHSSHASSRY